MTCCRPFKAANGRLAFERATLTWPPRGAQDGRAGQRLVWAVYLTSEESTPIIENIVALPFTYLWFSKGFAPDRAACLRRSDAWCKRAVAWRNLAMIKAA